MYTYKYSIVWFYHIYTIWAGGPFLQLSWHAHLPHWRSLPGTSRVAEVSEKGTCFLRPGTRPVEPTACGCDCLHATVSIPDIPRTPANLKLQSWLKKDTCLKIIPQTPCAWYCLIIIFPMKMTEHGNQMAITSVHDQTHHDTSNSSTDLTALRPSPSSPCISTWGATHQGPL